MPVTVEQLRRLKTQNPDRFEQNRRAMFAFSQFLYRTGQQLRREDNEAVGRQLEKYSEALEQAALDPTVPEYREKIDTALDTLSTMGEYLGKVSSSNYGAGNNCELVINSDADRENAFRDGLNAVNAYCGFQYNVNDLVDGVVDNPTENERREREQARNEWNQQRAREREQSLRQERLANQRRQQQENARRQRLENAERLEEQDRQREERRRERARQREAAEQRQREEQERRIQEERNLSPQQREQREREAQQREQQRQAGLRNMLSGNRDLSRESARNPETPVQQKKINLAEVVAYQRELNRVQNGVRPVNMDYVNSDIQSVLDGAAIAVAERQGRLDTLARMTPERLNEHVLNMEQEIDRYTAGNANSSERAGEIFSQLDDTWRFRKDSREYRDAKRAIQDYSNLQNPSQVDSYLAAQPVKEYVRKNLQHATSAVGKTRMACSMAFLKQTMSAEEFRIYCNNLNALRGIPNQVIGNRIEYDKSHPRCFVPEEIGTAEEVYSAARERVSESAQKDEKPSARDLAIMTAIKTLQAKNRGKGGEEGRYLIVEHEALQDEIEKVMRDPRFINAYQNRPNDELWEMGFHGNINTLQGYADPLRPEQQDRVNAARDRQEREERQEKENQLRAKRQAWEENETREVERRRQKVREAENLKRQEQENARREQERIQAEREEAVFLSKHTPAQKVYEDLFSDVQRLQNLYIPAQDEPGVPAPKKNHAQKMVDEVFGILNGKEVPEEPAPKIDPDKMVDEVFGILDEKPEPKESDRMAQDVFDEVLNENHVPKKSTEEVLSTLIALAEMQKGVKANPKYNDRMLNTAKLQKRIDTLKNDPVVKQMARDPKLVETVKNSLQEGQKKQDKDEKQKQMYSTMHLSIVLQKEHEKKTKDKEVLDRMTVADGYHAMKKKTDAVIRGQMDFKQAVSPVATMVALREFEEKGGVNGHLDMNALNKRVKELLKDPIIKSMGQTLTGPTKLREMEKTIAMKENREQVFGEMVGDMYKKEVEKKKALEEQNARKNQNEAGRVLQ